MHNKKGIGKMKTIKWQRRIVLAVGVVLFAGCRYGEVEQASTDVAYAYVVKDADSFAHDFREFLDSYVNEVLDVFSDKDFASYFDPEGAEFPIVTTKEYKSKYEVVYTDQRTFFSYRAECFRYTGGAHGGTTVKVGTVDVKTRKKLTVADVIPADKHAEARARVREALIAKIGGESNLMPSAKTALATLSENFYVGKDGLHFVFNEYEVACYAQGVVEVIIPAYGKYKMQ